MTQNLDQINYIIARFLINVENVDYRHKRFLETDQLLIKLEEL